MVSPRSRSDRSKKILLSRQVDGEMVFDDFVECVFAQGEAHRVLVKRIGFRGQHRVPDMSKEILSVKNSAEMFQPQPDIFYYAGSGDAFLAASRRHNTISDESEQSRVDIRARKCLFDPSSKLLSTIESSKVL